jgi:20S proteasome subunit beta 6
MQPFLDNQIGFKNQSQHKRPITLDMAINVARDAFLAAAERDIYTGDFLELFIITREGTRVQKFDLKKD